MNPEPPRAVEPTAGDGSLLVVLALLALVVGAVSGLVGALFLLALTQANHWRDELIGWAHGQRFIGFALVVGGCALLTALAAWLARRFSPHASGSGIRDVEATLHGTDPVPPAPTAAFRATVDP